MTARSFRSRPQFTQKQRVTGKIAKEVRLWDGKLPSPPYPWWLCHVRFQRRHPDNRSPQPTAPCYPKWHCRRTYSGKGDSAVLNLRSYEEFEAEAELRLKKEYGAVFGLFRYCVLTQDATYLCNKLDMQYVPQPTYPFFHLKMEDVWVWDKNRPTRIIPRAEVYTSSDVTVEELRGEGDEPSLTAEALAERIGESLGSDDEL